MKKLHDRSTAWCEPSGSTNSDRQRRGNRSEVGGLRLAREGSGARSAIRRALLGRLVHLFRRYENSRLEVDNAAGADSEGNSGRRDVIGDIDDNESVGVAEREIEALRFSAYGGK